MLGIDELGVLVVLLLVVEVGLGVFGFEVVVDEKFWSFFLWEVGVVYDLVSDYFLLILVGEMFMVLYVGVEYGDVDVFVGVV